MNENGIMRNPAISIITICYNIVDTIKPTCDSIVGQTFDYYEWIVVDGGSTDGTLDVLKRYADKITTLISEKDNGKYHAMNKGIAIARGEYLIFMNGGDLFARNDVLERVFKKREYSEDIIFGDYYMVQAGLALGQPLPLLTTPKTEKIDKFYFAHCCLNHQSVFIRRSLFERFGPYDENNEVMSDWEKWIVFASNGATFRRLPFAVAIFNTPGASGQTDILEKELLVVLNKYFTPEEVARAQKIRHNRNYSELIINKKEFVKPDFKNEYRFSHGYGRLFSNFHVVSTHISENGNKKKISFLGVPILKYRHSPNGMTKRYLFGFLRV